MGEEPNWEVAVSNWHEAVNGGDLAWAVEVVTDPVEVLGPRGAGIISATEFAGWVERSHISLEPYAWHPIADRVTVVQQRATWAEGDERTEPVDVVTVFVTAGVRIAAALRFDDLDTAMAVARARME